jgi:cobyrinic acid a,c-diamide synthase
MPLRVPRPDLSEDDHDMLVRLPRLVIAGLAGDSGKTLLAAGLARALTSRGLAVAPYKKGPDYIDAGWLGAAARRPGRNLDTYIMSPEAIGDALGRAGPADIVLVEGNRGLFDGLDPDGTHSTAELAKLLRAPVVLMVDVTKATRTVAAMVLGCRMLDRAFDLAGVVLNRVGSERHERVVRDAIRSAGGPPVLGALPRMPSDLFPSRHLGLLTAAEHPGREDALEAASEIVARHVDVQALLALAREAPEVEFPDRVPLPPAGAATVAVLRDESLSFYYPENLEALEEAGSRLRFVSPLEAPSLPECDAVYVGGGFPEVYVERLAANASFRRSLREAASAGLPVYAECGGLMYLGRELVVGGVSHPMAGILDLTIEQTASLRGHGYVRARVVEENPYFGRGLTLRGHEFHYSRVVGGGDRAAAVLRLDRGTGLGEGRDGITVGNVWGSYLHVHALGTPEWAPAVVARAGAGRDGARERVVAVGGGEARG